MLAHSFTKRTALFLLTGLLTGCGQKPSFNGVDLTGAAYARDFQLRDPDGKPRSLADLKGKVLVVFFGFTQCPDVCPSTMGELKAVKEAMGPAGREVVPVFITLDPERDTPEVLKAYGASFGPDFLMLRGSAEQTSAVANEFKVFYARVPGKVAGAYSLDHSAASFLFDKHGKVRVYVRPSTSPAELQADLQTLVAQN
jgi:protein SCO1